MTAIGVENIAKKEYCYRYLRIAPLFAAIEPFLTLKTRNYLAGCLYLRKGLRGRAPAGLHGLLLGQRQEFPRIVELLLFGSGQGGVIHGMAS